MVRPIRIRATCHWSFVLLWLRLCRNECCPTSLSTDKESFEGSSLRTCHDCLRMVLVWDLATTFQLIQQAGKHSPLSATAQTSPVTITRLLASLVVGSLLHEVRVGDACGDVLLLHMPNSHCYRTRFANVLGTNIRIFLDNALGYGYDFPRRDNNSQ